MFLYVCKQTFCKLYKYITREFLGLRMRDFQIIIFIGTQTLSGDFQICISVPLKIKQSNSEIMQSTQWKCCEIKITSCTCNFFIKRFPALHLNIFVPNIFNKRNLDEIQDNNILCPALITRRRVFLQKNTVRLLNKTVNEI